MFATEETSGKTKLSLSTSTLVTDGKRNAQAPVLKTEELEKVCRWALDGEQNPLRSQFCVAFCNGDPE